MAAAGGGGGVDPGAIRAGQAFVELSLNDVQFNRGVEGAKAKLNLFGHQAEHALGHAVGRQLRRGGIAAGLLIVGEAAAAAAVDTKKLNEELERGAKLTERLVESQKEGLAKAIGAAGEGETPAERVAALREELGKAASHTAKLQQNFNDAKDALEETDGFAHTFAEHLGEAVPIVGHFVKANLEAQKKPLEDAVKDAEKLKDANAEALKKLRDEIEKTDRAALKLVNDLARGFRHQADVAGLEPEDAAVRKLIDTFPNPTFLQQQRIAEAEGAAQGAKRARLGADLDELAKSAKLAAQTLGMGPERAALQKFLSRPDAARVLDPEKLEEAKRAVNLAELAQMQQEARQVLRRVADQEATGGTRGVTELGRVGLQQILGPESEQKKTNIELGKLNAAVAVGGAGILKALDELRLQVQ